MIALTPWLRLATAASAGLLIGTLTDGKLATRELKNYAASDLISTLPLADEGPTDQSRYVCWTVDPGKNAFRYLADPRNEERLQLAFSAMDAPRPPLKASIRVLAASAFAAVLQDGRPAITVPADTVRAEGPAPGLVGTAQLKELRRFQEARIPVVDDVPVAYRQALSLRFWLPGQSVASVVTLKPHKTPLGVIGDVEFTGLWPAGKGQEKLSRKTAVLFQEEHWGVIAPTPTSPVIAVRVAE